MRTKQIKYLLMTEFLTCYISFFLVFLICHCNYSWVINLAIKYFSPGYIFPRKVQNLQRYNLQKQPPRGIPRKRCSENMQQIYRRTPMPECDFNKNAFCSFIETTLRHGCSPVNLLHIFRTLFLKNTSGWLLLNFLMLQNDDGISLNEF